MKSLIRFICTMVVSTLFMASAGQSSHIDYSRALVSIKKLQPKLADTQAHNLAYTFTRVSMEPECQIPWQILVSIAYNESSLVTSSYNPKTKDYGIMQVNERNILRYGLSHDKVMKDTSYAVRFACFLVKENKTKFSDKHDYWLGIYRSGTALWKTKIKENAIRYNKMIRKTARSIGYVERS